MKSFESESDVENMSNNMMVFVCDRCGRARSESVAWYQKDLRAYVCGRCRQEGDRACGSFTTSRAR